MLVQDFILTKSSIGPSTCSVHRIQCPAFLFYNLALAVTIYTTSFVMEVGDPLTEYQMRYYHPGYKPPDTLERPRPQVGTPYTEYQMRYLRGIDGTEPISDPNPYKDVTKRINQSFSELFRVNSEGELAPHVCILCDRFIVDEHDKKVLTIHELYARKDDYAWSNSPYDGIIHDSIKSHYKYNPAFGGHLRPHKKYSSYAWLYELALSPRGSTATQGNGSQGFVCCSQCKSCIKSQTIPVFSIINGNHVGPVPDCISCLSAAEVAFLSSTKTYGCIFNYSGGTQKELKGTMSYLRLGTERMLKGTMALMDVEEDKVARTVCQIQAAGFDKHVVVVYSGDMTKQQKKNARKHCEVRTDKLISAVEWLCKYNRFWAEIDLDEIRDTIKDWKPIVVDNSKEVDDSETAERANVEDKQTFSVYLPDSSAQETNGGFDTGDELRRLLLEFNKNPFDIELKCNLEKRYVNYYEENWFVKANLLQFPYGIGGFNDDRLELGPRRRGNWNSIALDSFIEHWSKLSSPWFHRPQFVLMLYNIHINQQIFRTAKFVTRNPVSATAIASGLTSDDVTQAAWFRKNRDRYQGTRAARSLLDAVDNCSGHLPHSTKAARAARCKAEAMQHTFGMGSFFLTVTPDDDNCILLQVYTGRIIDKYIHQNNLDKLDGVTLKNMGLERTQLRLQYPGISAIYYEAVLQIVIRDVIGWDIDACKPTKKPGLFGKPLGFSAATEEQGRKSLHCHFIIWVENHKNIIWQIMQQQSHADQQHIIAQATSLHDTLITTDLFGDDEDILHDAFDHDCPVPKYRRKLPEVISDQELRYLRHKNGKKVNELKIATCPYCDKAWTMEELTFDYLTKGTRLAMNLESFPDKDGSRRLHAAIVAKQRELATNPRAEPLNPSICHATYDQHLSCHIAACFKCNNKSRKRKSPDDDECRYHLPMCKCRRTLFRPALEPTAWFDWKGGRTDAFMFDIVPRRNQYDLFQNTACRAIAESAVACNTNLQMQTGGPLAAYQMKYANKDTQPDDTSDYSNVQNATKKLLSAEMPRVHEVDKKEALRRVLRASFAHNSDNVLGAPMASHLLRYKERFIFSHKFAHLPIDHIIKLLINDSVPATVRNDNDGNYLENSALHYLCRHSCLEDISAFDFYTTYTTLRVTKANKDRVLPYTVTPHFRHPSVGNNGEARQASGLRDHPLLPKIQQWELTDTGNFDGDILHPSTSMTPSTEKYARFILTLFHPHRCLTDLTVTGSKFPFTEKLRETVRRDAINIANHKRSSVIFTDRAKDFLNKVQDSRSNCFRSKIPEDELVSRTEKLNCKLDKFSCLIDESGDADGCEADTEHDSDFISTFLDLSRSAEEVLKGSELLPNGMPQRLLLKHIRSKGAKRCGKDCWSRPETTPNNHDGGKHDEAFITTSTGQSGHQQPDDPTDDDGVEATSRKKYSFKKLATLLLDRSSAVRRETCFGDNSGDPLEQANGSARSIIQWAIAARLDKYQRRAFEIMVASFLLTFFDEATDTNDPNMEQHGDTATTDNTSSLHSRFMTGTYRSEKSRLQRLAALQKGNNQLIMLLHGPGGSGKSTVINLLLQYAREYCEALGHPFTNRTIVVSAFSGVAATLVKGDTTHRCCGLNRRVLTAEDQENWADTRMLLADEVSFAGEMEYKKLDKNLRYLMEENFLPYGGLHIVFSGDFRQLEPVGNPPIYDTDCPEFKDWVNCYIELEGMHRFSSDPEWGQRLLEFRNGSPSLETIRHINRHCVVDDPSQVPPGTQVATYYNRDRDAINTATFEAYCDGDNPATSSSVMILMDALQMPDSTKTSRPVTDDIIKTTFWEKCSENDCNKSRGRVDPVLKLYPGCPVMLTDNTCVAGGMANGTRARCLRVFLKPGESTTSLSISDRQKVSAVFASQVSEVLLEHMDPSIRPQHFSVKVTSHKFGIVFPSSFDEKQSTTMTGRQLSFVRNTCTTGHKLQGCSLHDVLVNAWDYRGNWHYVVLSRVRTMKGLKMREPLSEDLTKYMIPANCTNMIQTFRANCLAEPLPDHVYDTYMSLSI